MSFISSGAQQAAAFSPYLPALRRFARAMTGSLPDGDAMALAIADPQSGGSSDVIHLFRRLVCTLPDPVSVQQALLLRVVEGFTQAQIAEIMEVTQFEVADLIMAAQAKMQEQPRASVLIVDGGRGGEFDLQDAITGIGLDVAGLAGSAGQATSLIRRLQPAAILVTLPPPEAEAIEMILCAAGDIPAVFMAPDPACLLTGKGKEPVFVIPAPCREEAVQVVISQALALGAQAAFTP